MFRTASSVLHILPIAGLYTFLPKYLESQFRLPAYNANMISGNYREWTCERSLGIPKRIPNYITNDMHTPWEMNRVGNKHSDVHSDERSGGRRRKISPPDVRRDYDAKWIIWRKRQNGHVVSLTGEKNCSLTSFASCRKRQNLSANQTEYFGIITNSPFRAT